MRDFLLILDNLFSFLFFNVIIPIYSIDKATYIYEKKNKKKRLVFSPFIAAAGNVQPILFYSQKARFIGNCKTI